MVFKPFYQEAVLYSELAEQINSQKAESKEKGGHDIEEDLVGSLRGRAILTPGEETRSPQTTDKGTVEEGGNGSVESSLNEIEGEENRDQHGCHIGSALIHVQGGQKVVPCQHDYHCEDDT